MNLYSGMRGDNVRDLQRMLNAHGYELDADGIFGVLTKNDVMDYQLNHGLKIDGIAGIKTLTRLMSVTTEPVTDRDKRVTESVTGFTTEPPFPPMTPSRRAAAFGDFDWRPSSGESIDILGGWESRNIEKFYIPQLDGVPYYDPDGKMICDGNVYLHRKAGPLFVRWFQRIQDAGLIGRVRAYDGAFVARRQRGKQILSNHAWGTAMDINAYANGYHDDPAPAGSPGSVIELVPLAHECGIYWGGNFSGRDRDGMHFEAAVLP